MAVPALSVIIPTYGRAEQTARAVRSALTQDVDLEVVVVDDGSRAPIGLGVDDVRVQMIRLERNVGAAGARNAGVAIARARWISFLDSDDVWTPRSLQSRFDAARASGDVATTIWAAGFADVWPDGRRFVRIPQASARITDFVSGCWSCPGSTALLSREAWERSGGQDPALRRLEDFDWLIRWGKSGGRLAVHRGVAAEISRGGRVCPAVIGDAAAHLRAAHLDMPSSLLRRMNSYLQLELAASCLHHGDRLGGALALARSWALHPRLQAALEPFWAS